MFTKSLLLLAMTGLLIASPNYQSSKKEAQHGQKPAPAFLIVGKMPHFAKIVQQQWDNPSLNLTEEQKTKLTALRKKTQSGVMGISSEVNPLQDEVAKKALEGAKPEELKHLVDKIAALKAEATMVHLTCIYETKSILTAEQYDYLLLK